MAASLEDSLNESNVMTNFAGVEMNNEDSDEDIDDDIDIRDILGLSCDEEEWQTVKDSCTSCDPSSDSDVTIDYNEEVDVEDESSKREFVNDRQRRKRRLILFLWVQRFTVVTINWNFFRHLIEMLLVLYLLYLTMRMSCSS